MDRPVINCLWNEVWYIPAVSHTPDHLTSQKTVLAHENVELDVAKHDAVHITTKLFPYHCGNTRATGYGPRNSELQSSHEDGTRAGTSLKPTSPNQWKVLNFDRVNVHQPLCMGSLVLLRLVLLTRWPGDRNYDY
ncbi:hypothetical protein TNCV_1370611 [Trichonephila clavipes]|nr:hypothetical protein TNCV_1370611 [Trichonephila clavipes]